MSAVDRRFKKRTHYLGRSDKVIDRLKERRNVQLAEQTGVLRQQKHLQHVADRGCHADDVGADGLWGDSFMGLADEPEEGHGLVGFGTVLEARG